MREELDQGYVLNDQSYVLDDSDVNSDSTIPPTCTEAFDQVAEDDVRVLIANSRSTSCCLDPIPTHLLKSCSESLVSVITNIINSSLDPGIFPDCWKEAVIIPLLKKPGLESVFKNSRPVSNLAYISKLTERAVFNQIYRARSIQPKFPEISVQNSMDRFGPTGKVSKKLVHLLRWSSFPGRTGWNFG